jgi:hypothetical protein
LVNKSGLSVKIGEQGKIVELYTVMVSDLISVIFQEVSRLTISLQLGLKAAGTTTTTFFPVNLLKFNVSVGELTLTPTSGT